MPVSTAWNQRPGLQRCYQAAAVAVDRGLREDDSLFTPGRPIWSREVVDDLYRRFVENPDESSDRFEDKFRRQLAEAPDSTIQLAGELLFFHLLIAANVSGASKRSLINEVLSWAQHPVTIPDDLAEALNDGIAGTGVAFNTYRPHQLWFLLDFLRAWKELDRTERDGLLADAGAFKAFVWQIPIKAAYSQREALLHLVHPEIFEDIVSREHKRTSRRPVVLGQTAVDAQNRIGDARRRVRVAVEAHTYRAFDAAWPDGVRDGMSRAAD